MDISVLPGDDKSRISSVFHNTKNPFSGLEVNRILKKILLLNCMHYMICYSVTLATHINFAWYIFGSWSRK